MSDTTIDDVFKLQDALRRFTKDEHKPATIELVAHLYADMVTVRDVTFAIEILLAELIETKEQAAQLEKISQISKRFRSDMSDGFASLMSALETKTDG